MEKIFLLACGMYVHSIMIEINNYGRSVVANLNFLLLLSKQSQK